jgi:hypothetical protein
MQLRKADSGPLFEFLMALQKVVEEPEVVPANVCPAWVGGPCRATARNPFFSNGKNGINPLLQGKDDFLQ